MIDCEINYEIKLDTVQPHNNKSQFNKLLDIT